MQKKMYKRKSLVHFAKPHHLETKYRASKKKFARTWISTRQSFSPLMNGLNQKFENINIL